MPTVLRTAGLRLYFFSHEPNEPPHVHVDCGGATAKVWLETLDIARSVGFKSHELRGIIDVVRDNRERLLEAWHGHFGEGR